jgi:hypothetical protein
MFIADYPNRIRLFARYGSREFLLAAKRLIPWHLRYRGTLPRQGRLIGQESIPDNREILRQGSTWGLSVHNNRQYLCVWITEDFVNLSDRFDVYVIE